MCYHLTPLFMLTRDWHAAKVGTRVKHTRELKSHASYCIIGQKSQAGQAISLRLELASSSRQTTLFGKNLFFAFLLTLLYIVHYTHDIQRASRENFERETLKKNKIDSSTIFHIETLQIPLLSFSPLSNPWEVHYQNIFSPYPYLWEGHLVFGKQLRRDRFHMVDAMVK